MSCLRILVLALYLVCQTSNRAERLLLWSALLMKHHLIVRHVILTLIPHPTLVVRALEVVLWHSSLHALLLSLHVTMVGLLTPCSIHAIFTPLIRHRTLRLRGVVFCILREAHSYDHVRDREDLLMPLLELLNL